MDPSDDVIREQCKYMDNLTLYNFTISNKRAYNVCHGILAERKKKYQLLHQKVDPYFKLDPGTTKKTSHFVRYGNNDFAVGRSFFGIVSTIFIYIENGQARFRQIRNSNEEIDIPINDSLVSENRISGTTFDTVVIDLDTVKLEDLSTIIDNIDKKGYKLFQHI